MPNCDTDHFYHITPVVPAPLPPIPLCHSLPPSALQGHQSSNCGSQEPWLGHFTQVCLAHRSSIFTPNLFHPFLSSNPSEPHSHGMARNGYLIFFLILIYTQWPKPLSILGCLTYLPLYIRVQDTNILNQRYRPTEKVMGKDFWLPLRSLAAIGPPCGWMDFPSLVPNGFLSKGRLNSLRIEESWLTLQQDWKGPFLRQALYLLTIDA